jgi:hypothetical protein
LDVDPLAEWGSILTRIIAEDVPARKRNKILDEANLVATLIGKQWTVIDYGLDKSPLTLAESLREPVLYDLAAGYVACHILEIARPLEAVLSDLTHASYGVFTGGVAHVPDMWEHLAFLRETRWGDIRRRKRWP